MSLNINHKATEAYQARGSKRLTIDDLDEYIHRQGKPSPTMFDAIRFGELAMGIEGIFTKEESTRWFAERKAMLNSPDSAVKQEIDTRLRKEATDILSRQDDHGRTNRMDPSKVAIMQPICTKLQCRVCRVGNVQLYKCSGCESVWYCGREHQKHDWKRHKKECKSISTH